MDAKSILIDIGLSPGEAEIYLAVLKQGESLVSALSRTTGAHRTHIYDTLEKLLAKGLVNVVVKENRKYYAATNPKHLVDTLEEKQEQLLRLLPSLLAQQSQITNTASVEIYKGQQGLKIVLRDLVASAKRFYLFGTSKFEEVFPQYYVEKIVAEINRRRIQEYMLLEKGQKILTSKYGHYRYIPKKYLFPTAALMYNDKVIIFIWNQPLYEIVISDTRIAQSYISHFKLLWDIATPYSR